MKFMQIKPQKCRGKFLEDMWTDPAYSAENKEDGDRRLLQMCAEALYLTGTRESVDGTGYVNKAANVPHLTVHQPVKPLVGTVLDGEIVAPWAEKLPGGSSKHVTAIMGSSPERAIQLQKERGWLEYRVFDCLWFRGHDFTDSPLIERKSHLCEAVEVWNNPYVKICSAYTKESEKRRAWAKAREGLVFKHEDHTYGNEKLWVKLKKEATADVVLTGTENGKGKYSGTLGAIAFSQMVGGKLQRMGTCSGFDDALRAEIWRRKTQYRGRVFKIKHNGREPTGAFRHPRFDGWREDKSPKDCVYDPEET